MEHTSDHGSAEQPIVQIVLTPQKERETTTQMCYKSYILFTQFGCKYPQIKAESLHSNRAKIMKIVSMSQYIWT